MKKVILSILLLMIMAASAAYNQRDYIIALINGTRYSPEELHTQIKDNKASLKDELQKYTEATFDDITAEDEEKLLKGEITLEEISEKYKLSFDDKDSKITSNVNDSESTNNDGSSSNSDKSKAIDKAVSSSVSQMYALKATFVSELGEVARQAYTEYTSLPKEKQNSEGKSEVVINNINKVSQLEQNCDAKVEYLLSDLQSELEQLNGDTEIIQVLRNSYEEEKEIKKSYYLSLYYKQ